MIGVLAIGRLGNQLFQYAFARELADRLETDFFIKDENHIHQFYVDKYFKLKHFNRIQNYVRRLSNKKVKLIRIDQANSADQNFDECKNEFLYHGFYQSCDYFSSHINSIRNEYKIKDRYRKAFQKKNPDFFKVKNLIIHVRGGDYKNNQSNLLSENYYLNALEQIENIKKFRISLVTDDINYAKSRLPENLNYTYTNGNEIEDFLKIMYANVAIIANSSFAWWAAFLNEKTDKKILAPAAWLGVPGQPYPNNIFNNTNFIEIP